MTIKSEEGSIEASGHWPGVVQSVDLMGILQWVKEIGKVFDSFVAVQT